MTDRSDSPMTRPDASGFTPTGPRQPAAGVIWAPEQWASYGYSNWPHGYCFVCGGPLALPAVPSTAVPLDHSKCIASLDAYSDGLRAAGKDIVFPPRPAPDQYRFAGGNAVPGKSGNSSISADSVDSVEKALSDARRDADTAADNFDMMVAAWGEAKKDSALIDAVADAGVVIRPVDIGGDRRFSAEANGKIIASDHFPTWRAAALAGLARAKGAVPPPDLAR